MVMFTIYLHSSASHQSISLCLCSSHGINTNSPLSSRLRENEGKRQKKRQRGKKAKSEQDKKREEGRDTKLEEVGGTFQVKTCPRTTIRTKTNVQSGVKKYTAPHSPIMVPDKSDFTCHELVTQWWERAAYEKWKQWNIVTNNGQDKIKMNENVAINHWKVSGWGLGCK